MPVTTMPLVIGVGQLHKLILNENSDPGSAESEWPRSIRMQQIIEGS